MTIEHFHVYENTTLRDVLSILPTETVYLCHKYKITIYVVPETVNNEKIEKEFSIQSKFSSIHMAIKL